MTIQDSKTIEDVIRHSTLIPLQLHAENLMLKKELIKLYKREESLLDHIDKRDSQLEQAGLGHFPKVAGKNRRISSTRISHELEKISNELDTIQKRYDALRNSKLGKMQLWYWRLRAGK